MYSPIASNKVLIHLTITSIIPFLIWGPFFPDLIVSISAFFFIYFVFKNNLFSYYFLNKTFILFCIFCFYCILLSIFVAEDSVLSLTSSLFYFRIGVFCCFIWFLINNDKSILVYFYHILILCFLALVIDGYLQYFTGQNLFGLKFIGSSSTRVSSFFGDELIMGSYLSRLFPLLFALFLIKKKKKYESISLGILFILVDILIFISGERSAFFYLNLSTVVIILFIKEYQKFRLITFILALICVFIISINNSSLNDRMFKIPVNNLGLANTTDEKLFFTEQHDSLIKTAFNMFKDKPIVGHGPKMFRIICKEEKYRTGISPCMTHPHNFYVQLLAETGIIGFLFLFSALTYTLIAFFRQFISIIFYKKRYLSDYQVCLLASILITVWPISPNGNFFNNWLMIVYSLPIGFYLQSINKKND